MNIGNSQGSEKSTICGEKVLIFNNVPIFARTVFVCDRFFCSSALVAKPLQHPISFCLLRVAFSVLLPVPRLSLPPFPVAVLLVSFIFRVGSQLLPLPVCLFRSLAFLPLAIVLILMPRALNETSTAIKTDLFFHLPILSFVDSY